MPRVKDQSVEAKSLDGDRQAAPGKAAYVLRALLRGELAAIETYRQALAGAGPEAASLQGVQLAHVNSAARLRDRIIDLGGIPDAAAGAWGGVAKAVEGTAKLLGRTVALSALKSGEEYGLRAYEDALAGGDLDAASANLAAKTLLPRQAAHAGVLDRLIHAKAG